MGHTIRTATAADAQAMLDIYAWYVENTAITFETEVPTLEDFTGRIEHTLARYPWLAVEEDDGTIIGYAYASSFVGRAAYDWSVEMSIYLQHDTRRKGLGRELYGAMEDILRRMGIRNLNACIGTTDNESDPHLTNGSVYFHEKLGYAMVGKFHKCGFKFDSWYDMVWMEKMIGPHDGTPDPIVPFPAL